VNIFLFFQQTSVGLGILPVGEWTAAGAPETVVNRQTVSGVFCDVTFSEHAILVWNFQLLHLIKHVRFENQFHQTKLTYNKGHVIG
jgi:hypothetical protein